MAHESSLLITQSFVVSPAGTYWDYRDYLFCLASNRSVKDCPVRLNVERGMDSLDVFDRVAEKHGFSNFKIEDRQPQSWSSYMLEQIHQNPTEWTMPWPGDHIYVHPNEDAFVQSLKKGEELGADAVVYGHTMDFEYFLDWDLLNVLYNDPDYVMIEWGSRYRKSMSSALGQAAKRVIGHELSMTPVPGFVTYRSGFFKEVLEALPHDNKRWQDMEYSSARCARRFKLLIPKQCFYRHVHGYWLEGFFKYWPEGGFPKDYKKEIDTWYIRSEYDWEKDKPSREDYLTMSLERHPYFKRYFSRRQPGEFASRFGKSPFDPDWSPKGRTIKSLCAAVGLAYEDARYLLKKRR